MSGNGLTGLVNLGNTCFMNSAIQCLSNTEILTEYFLSKSYLKDIKSTDNCDLLTQWVRLLNGMWESDCIVSPNSFHKTFRIISLKNGRHMFSGFAQNDVQEFLTFTIDTLHECLSKEVSITIKGKIMNEKDKIALEAMKSWKLYFKDNYSKIIDIFYGELVNTISSYETNKVLSRSYQPMCFFTLPIPNKNDISIYDCLDLFCNATILDGDNKYKIEKTNKYVKAEKSITFWSLPKILIICLKRFDNNFRKINNTIDFPINNLDLTKYCIGYDKKNSIYDLYAISNHSGGLGGGHYYSYCKNAKTNKWYTFNDSHVSEMSENSLVKNTAYVLFYKKKIQNK